MPYHFKVWTDTSKHAWRCGQTTPPFADQNRSQQFYYWLCVNDNSLSFYPGTRYLFLIIMNLVMHYIYISSVYSLFSDRVGFPPHNTPFPGVLIKSIGAAFFIQMPFLTSTTCMGMQYQIGTDVTLIFIWLMKC